MSKAAVIIVFLLVLVCGCDTNDFVRRLDDGIEIIPTAPAGNVKKVRIRVVTPNIIHVLATAADTFSTAKSLIIARPDSGEQVPWELEVTGSDATIATAMVKARVSKKTGEVVFLNAEGEVLLKESEGGGKTFTPTTADGVPMYAVRQTFQSPDDEALYGLGGHQNGEMNYKGLDIELAQHNIVDVIPFLYSNRNYGLLWDNYSVTKFGDARAYQPLNSLHLFSKDGKPGGLTADYFVNDRVVKSFIEDEINYEFLETPQVENFPKDVSNGGKVVWEGSMASEREGVHKFVFYSSGYLKVWIDGKLEVDKWRQNWNPWTSKLAVNFAKDEKHEVRIEWIPQGGFLSVKHLDPQSPEEQGQISLASEAGDEINYYFINGSNADEVIGGYRKLTGKAPVVPRWAMGFWQSRERYRTQDELLEVVRQYRSRHIPLDNIVLDWQYWDDPAWGSHEFDRKRFPDPAGMIAQLHDGLHAHMMISVWPKFNKGTAHFEEMNRNGFLFTNNIEKRRKDWVGVGYESTFYDPFNPAAGRLFWQQIDTKLNSIGVDAWWLDATEPDMHSNLSLEERKKNMSPTALGPGAKYFNAYSLMNSKSVYEGSRASDSSKRVFILTRSAFAGQQRYGAATWSGDIASTWSDFKDQIATGINFSLSGIPYWTMDIGGFSV
ncbi:MAG TPA: TIM-barrel domain-containing protein [Chryseosolibacter sp.]|nr:TIM-barrel domain-containing protein [Chryseosolibacter sp.]